METDGKIVMNRTSEIGTAPAEPAEEAAAESPGTEAEAPGWPEFSGPLHLQQIRPDIRLLPDGDRVGPFLDYYSTDSGEREAGDLVTAFFRSYRRGVIDRKQLTAVPHPLFLEELEEFREEAKGIRAWYAGSFRRSGADASLRVSLHSDTGMISGVLYLRRSGEAWLLEDWEIPLDRWPGESLPESYTPGPEDPM